jgi:hypothetical protein
MARLSGTLPALNGSALTTLNASNVSSGTLNAARYSGGITMANQWRLTTDFTDDAAPISSNLEQVDTDGYGKLGGDMAVSSGIWTFPATGIYLLQFELYVIAANIDGLISMFIDTTTNNSSYSNASQKEFGVSRGSDRQMCSTQFIFDVTDTSTHKCRFNLSNASADTTTHGNSAISETSFTFIRLGDT